MTAFRRRRWVCLMYHNISGEWTGYSGQRSAFDVPRDMFEKQLDMIGESGLAGCSLHEAAETPDSSKVAITFDDGDIGQFEFAVSALVDRQMKATFFITTSWVDTPGFVSWEQLRSMKAAGMSIQSHTRSHPFLSELPPADVRQELVSSKDRLDQELEQDTNVISLPNGDHPRRSARHLLAETGYKHVATSSWGTNRLTVPTVRSGSPAYYKRCPIQGVAPIDHFKRVVLGDPLISAKRRARDSVLRSVRRILGPTRYARQRRKFLDAIS